MNAITNLLIKGIHSNLIGIFLGIGFFLHLYKDQEAWEAVLVFHYPIFLFKVIYLIRNPRDILVSGYFFWIISNFVKKPESLEQYFEWFIQGNGE